MPSPNLSPRSSMAKLAPFVAAAASASASASATSGPTAPPISKYGRTDSPFSREKRRAIRGKSKSTKGFAKALKNFENAMASQPRRSLSRTQSTRNVNKPKHKQVRRGSLPNFSPESRSSKGAPKAEFMELTKGLSDKERAALFNAMALRTMGNMQKLPKRYLVDSKAVAKLKEEQKKARQEMHAKVAAREHKKLQENLQKKKEKLEKFEKDLNKFKKAHQAKGNKVLDIPTEINSYIKRLNELITPNMSPEIDKMTQEIEYKKQYDKLNEHIKKLSKDYEKWKDWQTRY